MNYGTEIHTLWLFCFLPFFDWAFSIAPYLGAGVIEVGQLQVRLGLCVERDDGLHDLPIWSQRAKPHEGASLSPIYAEQTLN